MDNATRRAIDKVCWTTLREAGIAHPPVRVEVFLDHLKLHRDFYDLQSPGFLDRAKHTIRVHGRRLVELIQRVKLVAVLFYDEDRIVVDADLPDVKRDFPSFHEVAHRVCHWHQPFFYGDTAQTLDPDWHEQLESEANHGASTMMFCGSVFTREALDTAREWASVAALVTVHPSARFFGIFAF
jgi:Zn-dependent peptidase ImmA (M78 family)